MAGQTKLQSEITQKSTFVTVVAWLFIVFAGFSTLMTLLQNIMIHFMFPAEEMNNAINHPEVADQVPLIAEFMFNNFNLILFIIFLLSAFTLISAIALLKRKNWARLFFIVILSLGILWNAGGVVMQQAMFSSIPEMSGEVVTPPEFQTAMTVMRIGTIIFALAICAALGWIIKKFSSTNIKAEFV